MILKNVKQESELVAQLADKLCAKMCELVITLQGSEEIITSLAKDTDHTEDEVRACINAAATEASARMLVMGFLLIRIEGRASAEAHADQLLEDIRKAMLSAWSAEHSSVGVSDAGQ